ncbi:uncharacterized protein LOC144145978 isoform X2 [Haemaphysalis longicornis]
MRTPVETNFPRVAWTLLLGILLSTLIACGGNDYRERERNRYRFTDVEDEPQVNETQVNETQVDETPVIETPVSATPDGATSISATPDGATRDAATADSETTDGETPVIETQDGAETPPPKARKAKYEDCQLTSAGANIERFVSKCNCTKSGSEDYSEEYYYDEYNSQENKNKSTDSSEDPALLTRRLRALQDTQNSEESGEAPEDSTATTELPSSTTRPHINNGVVVDGTPCLVLVNINTTGRILTIGACDNGACSNKSASRHFVANPGLDPYEKHCKVNTTLINTKLRVAVGCIANCLEPINKTWNETKLDDGRPCALVTEKDNNKTYIKRTGACRNGSCVLANLQPWRHPRGCVERTVKREGRTLVESCWLPCANGTKEEVPDGTPCLLNHLRTVAVPPHVSKIIDEGICKHGQCIITPPAFSTLAVFVPEEGCTHAISSINYTHKVAATCGTLCHNRRKAFLPLRTPCALQSSGNWPLVTKTGECLGDVCIEKGPDTPPIHQTNEWSTNCRNKDYLTIVGGKLEFTERRVSEKINFVLKTYKTGVCDNGYCTLGKFPRTDLTLD